MPRSTRHGSPFPVGVFLGILLVMTLLYVGVLSVVYALPSQGPGPVPGPQTPPVPPRPVICPAMIDHICNASGGGVDPLIIASTGAAERACDPEYLACLGSQLIEMQQNRINCLKVPGCEFRYTTDPIDYQCHSDPDSCLKRVISLADGTTQVVYECFAGGLYDITGYVCERPAPPE